MTKKTCTTYNLPSKWTNRQKYHVTFTNYDLPSNCCDFTSGDDSSASFVESDTGLSIKSKYNLK